MVRECRVENGLPTTITTSVTSKATELSARYGQGTCSDITSEGKGNRNGWDSSGGVEVFGRRRDPMHVVGSDAKTNNLVSCQVATDAIFAMRQLMEKHREKQKGLQYLWT